MTEPGAEVRAYFGPLGPDQATLTLASRGRGRIVTDRVNWNYALGETAVLVPQPDQGQTFLGWSGDVSGADPEIDVLVDRSKTVIATFSRRPQLSWVDGLGYGRGESLRLQIEGQPGFRHGAEFSTDLRTWAPLLTVNLRSEREILGIFPGMPGIPTFYRAVDSPSPGALRPPQDPSPTRGSL